MKLKPLFRLSLRHSRGRPIQKLLLFLGIAIGVAVVVAIDLANESIGRSFQLSTESLTGKATHQIIGSSEGFDQQIYTHLKRQEERRRFAPVVTDFVQLGQMNQRTMRLLGVDPFVESDFRNYLIGFQQTSEQNALVQFLTHPNSIYISEVTSSEYGLKPGDTLILQTGKGRVETVISGLLKSRDSFTESALRGMILCDISTAQEILDMGDRISHIDLILQENPPNELKKLQSLLPEGLKIVSTRRSNQSIRQMSQSFELNLRALSLLALLVGMFLIYNTITFSVVQQRTQIGILRALGLTRGEIFVMILGETLFWGIIGTLAGLILGIALGTGTIKLVSQTISDLYFTLTVNQFFIAPAKLIKAGLMGIFATLVAAVFPALEAAGFNVINALKASSLERKFSVKLPLFSIGGFFLLVAGSGLLRLSKSGLQVSFSGLLLIVIGSSLLVPLATLFLMKVIGVLLSKQKGVIGRMVVRNISRSLSRTSVSIASLMIAVSVIVGVGIMVGSFRTTVIQWLHQTIQADLYIRSANRIDPDLDVAVKKMVSEVDGVAKVYSIRSINIRVGPYQNSSLVSLDEDIAKRDWIWAVAKEVELKKLFEEGWVFVSESFAWRHQIKSRIGEGIRLPTDRGEKPFRIAGIFRDFTSDQGLILIKDQVYRQYWNYDKIFGVSAVLEPDADSAGIRDQIEKRMHKEGYWVVVTSNDGLREAAVEIFDRTFTITAALQILAGLVAFIGVLSTVMSLMLERSRELGVLRANGLTLPQMWRMILSESGMIGLLSALYSIPLGTAMAWILVFIINKMSFGWTLEFVLQSQIYVQAGLVAVISALLAGIYPALMMTKSGIASLLRTE